MLKRKKIFSAGFLRVESTSFNLCLHKGRVLVSEIVYVGQCEVFLCFDFVYPPPPPNPLAAKLIGPWMGCQFF